MRKELNINKISEILGAELVGEVKAGGGAFGAQQLLFDIENLKAPPGGGRVRNPTLNEKRLIALSKENISHLKKLSRKISELCHTRIDPMKLASLILNRVVPIFHEDDLLKLVPAKD